MPKRPTGWPLLPMIVSAVCSLNVKPFPRKKVQEKRRQNVNTCAANAWLSLLRAWMLCCSLACSETILKPDVGATPAKRPAATSLWAQTLTLTRKLIRVIWSVRTLFCLCSSFSWILEKNIRRRYRYRRRQFACCLRSQNQVVWEWMI